MWNLVKKSFKNTHVNLLSTVFRRTSHKSLPFFEFRTPIIVPHKTTRLYSVSTKKGFAMKKVSSRISQIIRWLPFTLFDLLVKCRKEFERIGGRIDLASDCCSIFVIFCFKPDSIRFLNCRRLRLSAVYNIYKQVECR